MEHILIADIPVLLYCIKPRPSTVLRMRFGPDSLDRCVLAGMTHVIDYGFDIYDPASSYSGDAIIQISPQGVNFLLLGSAKILLALAPVAIAILGLLLK